MRARAVRYNIRSMRSFSRARLGDRANDNRRLVAGWLFAVAFMVLVMIVLGGATRLTGSGLSIMEWAPFAGVLPPWSEVEWQRLFQLYQQIPQYALLHEGMALAGFKQIFWLEWIHRLWGRLIGLAFIVPLIWFWATGRIERRLAFRLALIFLLGGLQGAVGWFMVGSGFAPESTAVSPYRLVIHLALALALYVALLWTGLSVLRPMPLRSAAPAILHGLAWACSAGVALTMLSGGFVAGTHAGLAYNTFPLMEGRLVPNDYAWLSPFVRNLTENIGAVQFDHRLLATLTLAVAIASVIVGVVVSRQRVVRLTLLVLLSAALAQYLLGVLTLLLIVPAALATVHQAMAGLLLTAAVVLLHTTRPSATAYPIRVAKTSLTHHLNG
jgi:cytochrome c oxidase assembly protein subunit 15